MLGGLLATDHLCRQLPFRHVHTAEVTIGTAMAVLVSLLLSPDMARVTHRAAPGRSDLLGAQWASVQHALRAGAGVMLVPWVWNWLELPNLSQTAITVAAVMAVPAPSEDEIANREQIVLRSAHRVFGCLIGGVVGLVALSLSLESFVPCLILAGVERFAGITGGLLIVLAVSMLTASHQDDSRTVDGKSSRYP